MKYVFLYISILWTCSSHSQSLHRQVVDVNGNPVPFATIQTTENQGTISNHEGFFTIDLDAIEKGKIVISCMGYTQRTLSIEEISKSERILLEEFINELQSVYLSNTTPNVDVIMKKVRDNLTKNYRDNDITHQLFYRNTSYIDFGDLSFEIDKASRISKRQLAGVNSSLDSLTNVIKNNKSIHFKDFLADYMIEDKSSTKINVRKATELIDTKNNMSIEKVQDRAQALMLKYLDTTKTYKVKTGIIKIEDSLSFSDVQNEDENEINEYSIKGLKNESLELLKDSQKNESSTLHHLINNEYYDFSFLDFTYMNEELIYVIKFAPRKSKSKYSGKLYIADDTFAVVRADYSYAKGKRGKKFNLKFLLGIKYIENHSRGTIIYNRIEDGYYQPKYIYEENGNYFYVKRPIKFIENSRTKNKVAFTFLIEGNTREKNEMLIVSTNKLDKTKFSSFEESEKVEYLKLNKYDPSIWQEETSLEPLQEMKTFKAEGKE